MREYVLRSTHTCLGNPLTRSAHIVFIAEITARAFIVADANKRRTLSRADISKALGKSDQFDFLIDIVPREEAGFGGASGAGGSSAAAAARRAAAKIDQVCIFLEQFSVSDCAGTCRQEQALRTRMRRRPQAWTE